MMRIVDVLYSLPYIILVIVLLAVFRRNTPLGQLVLLFVALGSVSWLTMARIVRGQVLSLKNQSLYWPRAQREFQRRGLFFVTLYRTH